MLPLVSAVVAVTVLTPVLAAAPPTGSEVSEPRRLSVDDYIDKMKAGWVGQMAGVDPGAPTEFKFKERIIPVDKMPTWKPSMINQFNQDDIYVEMTFLRTLEEYGMDVSIRQAGIDFANSEYRLWHANRFGRENLRNGIAPPDSGHPQFNKHADDIDYQIEADFSGLITPFSRPPVFAKASTGRPVRPDGWFRGLLSEANSLQLCEPTMARWQDPGTGQQAPAQMIILIIPGPAP